MTKRRDIDDFENEWRGLGANDAQVMRIWRAWFGVNAWEPKAGQAYSKALNEAMPQIQTELNRLATTALTLGAGEVKKLLVSLADRQSVEAVTLPRRALCISTQVGCAVGCRFCMTGKGGLIRQLGSAEIIAQVRLAKMLSPQIKKVVMMGMGEPSHNLNAVCDAVEFLGNILEFAHKEIVVSSVGDRRLFERLPKLSVKPAMALSLHTTKNDLRRELLPNAPKISVEDLLEMTLNYAQATKYPAQIEWVLIEGVNDSYEEVERLAELIRGRLAMVNFIAVNPVEGSCFQRPSDAHIQDLITILRQSGTVATLRDSAAQDIDGGCGQLRARHIQHREI